MPSLSIVYSLAAAPLGSFHAALLYCGDICYRKSTIHQAIDSHIAPLLPAAMTSPLSPTQMAACISTTTNNSPISGRASCLLPALPHEAKVKCRNWRCLVRRRSSTGIVDRHRTWLLRSARSETSLRACGPSALNPMLLNLLTTAAAINDLFIP